VWRQAFLSPFLRTLVGQQALFLINRSFSGSQAITLMISNDDDSVRAMVRMIVVTVMVVMTLDGEADDVLMIT
jgi:hypothetical protein